MTDADVQYPRTFFIEGSSLNMEDFGSMDLTTNVPRYSERCLRIVEEKVGSLISRKKFRVQWERER